MSSDAKSVLHSCSTGSARIYFLVLVLLLGTAFWMLPQYSLNLIGNVLLVDDQPEQADAVVVLIGGGVPDRILKAFQLYKQGYADKIVFGSGYIDKRALKKAPNGFVWLPWSHNYSTALLSLRVPTKDIVIVNTEDAFDTSSELSAISNYGRQKNWQKVLLVSSTSHTRRVDIIWHRVCSKIEHRTIAADPRDLNQWWKRGRMRRAVAYEWLAFVKESLNQLKSLFSS